MEEVLFDYVRWFEGNDDDVEESSVCLTVLPSRVVTGRRRELEFWLGELACAARTLSSHFDVASCGYRAGQRAAQVMIWFVEGDLVNFKNWGNAELGIVIGPYASLRCARKVSSRLPRVAWIKARIEEMNDVLGRVILPSLKSRDFEATFETLSESYPQSGVLYSSRASTVASRRRRDYPAVEVRAGSTLAWGVDVEDPVLPCVTNIAPYHQFPGDEKVTRRIVEACYRGRDVSLIGDREECESVALECFDVILASLDNIVFDCVWKVSRQSDADGLVRVLGRGIALVWLDCDIELTNRQLRFLTINDPRESGQTFVIDPSPSLRRRRKRALQADLVRLVPSNTPHPKTGPPADQASLLKLPGLLSCLKNGSSPTVTLVNAFVDDDGSIYLRLCLYPTQTDLAEFLKATKSFIDTLGFEVDDFSPVVRRQETSVVEKPHYFDHTLAVNLVLTRRLGPSLSAHLRPLIFAFIRDDV